MLPRRAAVQDVRGETIPTGRSEQSDEKLHNELYFLFYGLFLWTALHNVDVCFKVSQ